MSWTVPAGSAGVVAVICVKEETLTPVAAMPPTVTAAPSRKSVPARLRLVPPAGGPEPGLDENGIRWENSEVLPEGSVAVAVIRAPVSTCTGNVRSKVPLPRASVVTWLDPIQVCPSRNSRGKLEQAGFA